MRRAYSAGVRPASTGSAPTRRRCAVRGARKGGRSRQGGRDDAPVATPARRARRFRPLASLAPTAALVDGRRRLRSAAAAAALLCAGRSSSWVSRPESLGHARWDDRDGRFQPRDHTMAGAPVVANGGGEGGREGESRGFCSSLLPSHDHRQRPRDDRDRLVLGQCTPRPPWASRALPASLGERDRESRPPTKKRKSFCLPPFLPPPPRDTDRGRERQQDNATRCGASLRPPQPGRNVPSTELMQRAIAREGTAHDGEKGGSPLLLLVGCRVHCFELSVRLGPGLWLGMGDAGEVWGTCGDGSRIEDLFRVSVCVQEAGEGRSSLMFSRRRGRRRRRRESESEERERERLLLLVRNARLFVWCFTRVRSNLSGRACHRRPHSQRRR